MNDLDGVLAGLSSLFQLQTLLSCFSGVFLGTLIGVLPGVGPLAALSLLLPLTYYMDPGAALIFLSGVYYGTQYGGAITSILLNIPGTATSAVTCIDGGPMAKAGRAHQALTAALTASFVGSMIGIAVILLFAPLLAVVGFMFGPSEYFAALLLGLIASASVGGSSALKNIAMAVLGVLLGVIGLDVNSGIPRFSFGVHELYNGLSIVALAMGLFGITEVMGNINLSRLSSSAADLSARTSRFWANTWPLIYRPILRGSAIGAFFGTLPGTGPGISSFMAYAFEKKVANEPDRFGHGAIEGVAAPEAANNSAAMTAFIPTLMLGIPGEVVMSLLLGAMIIHGLQPGPMLATTHPDIFWGLIFSFGLGNVLLLAMNLPLLRVWAALLKVPFNLLYPMIVVLICIGSYSVGYSTFDLYVVAATGVIGYWLVKADFSPAPLLLGFVLGPMVEENFRRAMLMARGDLIQMASGPITAGFLLCSAGLLFFTIRAELTGRRAAALAEK
ncbi:tripartite tricarboxylate transporter permease [Pararhodobacter sp.]|uniref:tripartite tricarboxylate transporter permease n=1 Tax=Pararhodobacter sp. TaxID=2127056 RepID=UPI002AFE8516|nr:tripartite tricarboxylate transporter permease [Pararhodobacter sp.]